jgi:thiol-disulfide isomerase/thioredoxin
MAVTPSTMLPLGTPAPAFALPDITGDTVSSETYKGYPLLVMFICNHCPFVIHVAAELAQLGKDYRDKLAIIAINSNDVSTHPDDAPDKMKLEAAQRGYAFPYLYDESQEVAKAYRAACTPDFFLFDKDHKLVYRGQLDDSRPNSDIPVTGADLRAAIDAVLAGKPVSDKQRPSAGCNIKWKAGNAPEYFG